MCGVWSMKCEETASVLCSMTDPLRLPHKILISANFFHAHAHTHFHTSLCPHLFQEVKEAAITTMATLVASLADEIAEDVPKVRMAAAIPTPESVSLLFSHILFSRIVDGWPKPLTR